MLYIASYQETLPSVCENNCAVSIYVAFIILYVFWFLLPLMSVPELYVGVGVGKTYLDPIKPEYIVSKCPTPLELSPYNQFFPV